MAITQTRYIVGLLFNTIFRNLMKENLQSMKLHLTRLVLKLGQTLVLFVLDQSFLLQKQLHYLIWSKVRCLL